MNPRAVRAGPTCGAPKQVAGWNTTDGPGLFRSRRGRGWEL